MFWTFDSRKTVHINIICVSYLSQSAVPIEGKSILLMSALAAADRTGS